MKWSSNGRGDFPPLPKGTGLCFRTKAAFLLSVHLGISISGISPFITKYILPFLRHPLP